MSCFQIKKSFDSRASRASKAVLYPILCDGLYFQIQSEIEMSRYYVAYIIAKMGVGKVESIIQEGLFYYIKMKEWWNTSTNYAFQQKLLKNEKYYLFDKKKILTFSRITTIEKYEMIYDTTNNKHVLSEVVCIGESWIKVIQGTKYVIIQAPHFSKDPRHPFYSLKCVLFPERIVRSPYTFHLNPKIPEEEEYFDDVYLFVSLFQYKYKKIKHTTNRSNIDQRDFVVEEYFVNKADEELILKEKINA
jgi:hypothetical protein